MAEYLSGYGLPLPPKARYGFTRVQSPQEKQRVALLAQAWVPAHATATVLVIHGYSEHTGNYSRLIRDFVDARLAVIALDLRGHGLSEGPSGHTPGKDSYAEDVEKVVSEIFPLVAVPGSLLFLWAHSLGALTALQVIHRGRLPEPVAGAVLTSPLLGFPKLTGFQKMAARFSPLLSRITPALPISHGVAPIDLSHDETYLARRHDDPLVRHVTTPRWFESVKAAVADVQNHASDFSAFTPTLLMLAGEERITNLFEARRFAIGAYSGRRHKVIEYPGMFHELEKEPELRPRIVSESVAWYRSHC
jgi:alpha-beta hydrolase superfamily lysophospholipase